MAVKITKAVRAKTPIKLALSGPPGVGKTLSGLFIGYGMTGDWDAICMIDTENESGKLYADSMQAGVQVGSYGYILIEPPFEPQKYIDAIKAAEEAGYKFILIDSLSHAWAGTGGILEMHSKKQGNSFTNWRDITPIHNKLLDTILQSKCDIVPTMRTKIEYAMEDGVNAKGYATTTVKRIGTKVVQREGMEYEFTTVLSLSQNHYAEAVKDRTGLFDGKTFIIDVETGEKLKVWRDGGAVTISDTVIKPIEVVSAVVKQVASALDYIALIQSSSTEEENKRAWAAAWKAKGGVMDADLTLVQEAYNKRKMELTSPPPQEQVEDVVTTIPSREDCIKQVDLWVKDIHDTKTIKAVELLAETARKAIATDNSGYIDSDWVRVTTAKKDRVAQLEKK